MILRPAGHAIRAVTGSALVAAIGSGDLGDGDDATGYRWSGSPVQSTGPSTPGDNYAVVDVTFPAGGPIVPESIEFNVRGRRAPGHSGSVSGCTVALFDSATRAPMIGESGFLAEFNSALGTSQPNNFPDTTITTINNASSFAGTWGFIGAGGLQAVSDALVAGRLQGLLVCGWDHVAGTEVLDMWLSADPAAVGRWPLRARQRDPGGKHPLTGRGGEPRYPIRARQRRDR